MVEPGGGNCGGADAAREEVEKLGMKEHEVCRVLSLMRMRIMRMMKI